MYNVRLFARARDLAGSDTVAISLNENGTVADIRAALTEKFPMLQPLLPRCAVAIDSDFATDQQIVPPNAVLAIIPPVSGG